MLGLSLQTQKKIDKLQFILLPLLQLMHLDFLHQFYIYRKIKVLFIPMLYHLQMAVQFLI
jgi:hypothetical protein